jgi:hypothetical protein
LNQQDLQDAISRQKRLLAEIDHKLECQMRNVQFKKLLKERIGKRVIRSKVKANGRCKINAKVRRKRIRIENI